MITCPKPIHPCCALSIQHGEQKVGMRGSGAAHMNNMLYIVNSTSKRKYVYMQHVIHMCCAATTHEYFLFFMLNQRLNMVELVYDKESPFSPSKTSSNYNFMWLTGCPEGSKNIVSLNFNYSFFTFPKI